MSDTEEAAFAARLESLTEPYLADVTACTGTLAPALEQYGTGDGAFAERVERASTLESDCDVTVRELRRPGFMLPAREGYPWSTRVSAGPGWRCRGSVSAV